MSRSSPTIPFALLTGEPQIKIAEESWQHIERAYRHPLSPAIRQSILEVTTSFVYFEQVERNAQRFSLAKKRVELRKKAARALYDELFSAPPADASAFADCLIEMHFAGSQPPVHNRLERLGVELVLLAGACDQALDDIMKDYQPQPRHREGMCWDNWIRDLTRILEGQKLPTAVSKGSHTYTVAAVTERWDAASQYTQFVHALQACVPKAARRHTTPDALAWAINKAQRGGKSPKPCHKKTRRKGLPL